MNLGAHGLDHAACLVAHQSRKIRLARILTGAKGSLRTIEPDGLDAQAQLAGAGFTDFEILEAQNLWTALGMNSDYLAHVACSAKTKEALSVESGRRLASKRKR